MNPLDPVRALFRSDVEMHVALLREKLRQANGRTLPLRELRAAIEVMSSGARILHARQPLLVLEKLERQLIAAEEGREVAGVEISQMIGALELLADLAAEKRTLTDEEIRDRLQAGIAAPAPSRVGDGIQVVGVLPSAPKPPVVIKTAKAQPPSADKKEVTGDLEQRSMLDFFRTDVANVTSTLNEGLIALEHNPKAKEPLQGLMRAAHSLKGSARIMGFDGAVQVAHVMEDVFVAAQGGKIELKSGDVDTLLKGVDLLSNFGKATAENFPVWLAANQKLIEGITTSIGQLAKTPASSPAPSVVAVPAPSVVPAPAASVVPVPATSVFPAPIEAAYEAVPVPSRRAAKAVPPLDAGPSRPDMGARAGKAAPPLDASPSRPDIGGARRVFEEKRLVRVTAENINRIMGLVGESVVETRWLEPFGLALLDLRRRQIDVSDLLEKIHTNREDDAAIDDLVGQAQQRIAECEKLLADRSHELESFTGRISMLSENLYREAIASRMRPFSDGIAGLRRNARDLSRRLGKKVRLDIVGQNTEVDRDILEKLDAPLTHLVRNAIDHGLETPEERVAANKAEEGVVRVEAKHRGGMLIVEVADDGRGIQLEAIRNKVLEERRAPPEIVEAMGAAELLSFLFVPGFTTASKVTEISGRGVGLDVVEVMVQSVGGMVRAESNPGEGLKIHLELPLTRSVIRTLIVSIAGEPYAFPLSRIDRALAIPRETVRSVENRQYFMFDGGNIGLVDARQVFELDAESAEHEDLRVVVISDHLKRFGLVVDEFLGERDLVVHALDPRLPKVTNISAAAILQDGSPVLIADVEDMVRSIDNLLSGRLRRLSSTSAQASIKKKKILVVDDSLAVREMQRRLLENRGYEVDVAVDGMDGWNGVRAGQYDLVISDVDMPRMTGIELVSKIKSEPGFRGIPVIIVSYKDREEDRMRGLAAGADYYLTKSSFHDETFARAVADLIGKRGHEDRDRS